MTEENRCRTVLMISVDQSKVNFHLLTLLDESFWLLFGLAYFLTLVIWYEYLFLHWTRWLKAKKFAWISSSLQVKKKPLLTLGGDVVVVVDVICVNRCVILFYTLNKNNKFGTYKKQHGKKWCTFINSYLRLKTRRVSSPPFVLVWSCCVAVATRHRRPCSLE